MTIKLQSFGKKERRIKNKTIENKSTTNILHMPKSFSSEKQFVGI